MNEEGLKAREIQSSDVLLPVAAGLGTARLFSEWRPLVLRLFTRFLYFLVYFRASIARSHCLLIEAGPLYSLFFHYFFLFTLWPSLWAVSSSSTSAAVPSPPTPRGDLPSPAVGIPFGRPGTHRHHIMKGTSIFQFKSWPKIHQPLPRTPRESQQLLNALTSSFRRQLDHAYPASNVSNHNEGDRQPLNTESSAHATDKHLHNILDNPLFRIVPPKPTLVSHDRNALRSVEEQRRLAEEPMLVFDELVASGSATVPAVTECLKSQLVLARSRDGQGVSEAMKASRAASRVVNWFWASDGASRRKLLQSRPWTTALTKFMVAEGLHNNVLDWLRLLINRDLGGDNGLIIEGLARQTFSHLLIDFLDAEIRYGNGFGSALKFYLRACQLHFTSPQADASAAKPMLLAAGAQLSRVAMDQKPSIENVSISLYEEFMDVISTLTSTRSLLFASVAVCHPSQPDPQPFIRIVETLSPSKFQKYNTARRDAFLRVGCDALRILMVDRDNYRGATKLAQQMQHLLPNTTDTTANEKSRNRAASEDYLLNRLDLNMT